MFISALVIFTDLRPKLSVIQNDQMSVEGLIAELSRARRVRSGAPWLRKYGYLPIREILVIT